VGPSPVSRARNASKHHHLLVDATGIPLAWRPTGGNRHDVTQLIPLVERIPPVRAASGDRADGPTGSPPTATTTTTPTAASCANEGSNQRSPGARPSTAPASAVTAGSWSAHFRLAAQLPPAPHPLGTP